LTLLSIGIVFNRRKKWLP